MSSSSSGVPRLRAKLKLAVESQNWYEAHQIYRTLNFRLLCQRKFTDLESLLFEGAQSLFSVSQTASAVDLTKCYLEAIRKGDFVAQDERVISRVASLCSLIPRDHPERDTLVVQAVDWSRSSSSPHGSPRLHQLLAYHLWRAKRYCESRYHFLYSLDGCGFGCMLVDYHCKGGGLPSEVDLFVAGTVLQLICLRKHIVAAIAFKAYTENHPSIQRKGPPYSAPLLNFVWLLLLAIEHRESLAVFSILIEKYKPSLYRDPLLLEYLDKIGQNFFGLPPPQRPRPGGMFSGILDQLFTALGDEDETGAAGARPGAVVSRMETEDLD